MDKIDKNKLILPLSIVLGCLILAGSLYAIQVNKQNSIEKQQRVEQTAKMENSKKDYLAKQKTACLDIYKQESIKWNNTTGWRYDNTDDICYVEYKASPKKTVVQCDASYKGEDGKVYPIFINEWLLCKEGLFEKSF